ncbi:MAG TPA: aldo/keto reductase [Chthoniobacterales bacterium]|nr:aldo/keto reductase [Chthoniobacterales bacterium]
MHRNDITRRQAAKLIGGTAASLLLPIGASRIALADETTPMITRSIPSSGEKLPVIGLGTWQTFDVGTSQSDRGPLEQVLSELVKFGGRVIDSSPMYGRSEQVIGDLATKLRLEKKLFLATKVWTTGRDAGIQSMERSFTRFQTKRIDLMQVHNLVDVNTHLQTMREWKAAGRFRYIGVTHYNESAFSQVEKVLRSEKLDFLQINYSLGEPEADQRILPAAQERGVAVMINRPFGGGGLFGRVRSKPLPEWAAEFDCHSWAQFLLKWILGHSAVTCVIPATGDPGHLRDNAIAGTGKLPDAKMRQRMAEYIRSV